MSSYSSCLSYEDIKCKIHIDGHIFLFMDTAESSIEVTLNPNQAKLLGEALINGISQISVGSLDKRSSDLFGDFETVYEIAGEETKNEHNTGEGSGSDTGSCSGNFGADQRKEIKIA